MNTQETYEKMDFEESIRHKNALKSISDLIQQDVVEYINENYTWNKEKFPLNVHANVCCHDYEELIITINFGNISVCVDGYGIGQRNNPIMLDVENAIENLETGKRWDMLLKKISKKEV